VLRAVTSQINSSQSSQEGGEGFQVSGFKCDECDDLKQLVTGVNELIFIAFGGVVTSLGILQRKKIVFTSGVCYNFSNDYLVVHWKKCTFVAIIHLKKCIQS